MNVAGLVAYALAVALVLASGGWLLERALTTLRLPVRWVWLGALGLSVWLPLASFVSDREPQGGAGATHLRKVVAPIDPAGIVDVTTGDGGQGAGAALELVVKWRTGVSRGLASAAGLLPRIVLAPAWIAGVWGASSILLALILLASMLRVSRRARRWPDERLLGRHVKVSPDMGPATVGLLTPLIVIPRWARELPPHDLELVLCHEGEHVCSRDTLILALGLAALVACPWNPIVWWQLRRLKAAVEVDCDRRILRDGVAPARYGDLLVRLGSRGLLDSLAAPTIVGSTSLLERRLTIMKETRGRTSFPTALAAMALALLLVVVACTTEAPVATEQQAATEPPAPVNTRAASEPSGEDVVAIRIHRDGTVHVNGVAYPVDRVSEAVAPLYSADALVSIQAHQAVPYRVVSAVQDQLRAARLLRVVFTTVESEARRSPTRDVSALVDEGLPMVLPDATMPDIDQVNVDSRNLLVLEVLPAGIVEAWRGEESQVIAPRHVEDIWRRALAQNPNLIAVVRTRPDAEYRHYYEVLDALQRAEAERIALQLAE